MRCFVSTKFPTKIMNWPLWSTTWSNIFEYFQLITVSRVHGLAEQLPTFDSVLLQQFGVG